MGKALISPYEPKDTKDTAPAEPRAGSICPKCQEGIMDFDVVLNLACDRCGYSLAGCFT